ncbi:hypothetical protein BTH_I1244 [Burkholderia thailandensis E264]|uniref:Uncharacterized protein n=1 Tax=Burkholderia thailandensis (strain ATCC 700388 / DSM 13276 / CCUG 48851 / CIP 106301 / E264) TaxID=271848 RepID=Q2SZ58_BURTA|nr:hypothetical protein BTH_I1244 [Burkholderia thailandensis E264]
MSAADGRAGSSGRVAAAATAGAARQRSPWRDL